MSVSGPLPVGSGGPQMPAAQQISAPTNNAAAAPTTQSQNSTTAQIQNSTTSTTFLARLGQDSPLRTALQQMTALELQAMILNMLLGGKDEDSEGGKAQELLAMSLLGALMEGHSSKEAMFFSNTQTSTMNMSVVSTQEVVAAYGENQAMPQTAADPGAATQATPAAKIDTTA